MTEDGEGKEISVIIIPVFSHTNGMDFLVTVVRTVE